MSAALAIDRIEGAAGEVVELIVRLETRGHQIAGTENVLRFGSELSILAMANGRPECIGNHAIDKNATSFAFQPAGCHAAGNCTAIKAIVLSVGNVDAIPDGVELYRCAVQIPSAPPRQAYKVDCELPGASDSDGNVVPIACAAGEVVVR